MTEKEFLISVLVIIVLAAYSAFAYSNQLSAAFTGTNQYSVANIRAVEANDYLQAENSARGMEDATGSVIAVGKLKLLMSSRIISSTLLLVVIVGLSFFLFKPSKRRGSLELPKKFT